MRKAKYEGESKPRRVPSELNAIEKFDAAARARGMTYAEAQVEETCRMYQRRFNIPEHYKKAGKRVSRR